MERTVFVLGVAAAIIFAVVSLTGGPRLHFVIDGVGPADPVIEAKAEQIAERVYVGREIEADDAALRLIITPEARQDIAVSIDNPGRLPTPVVTLEGGRLVLDGRLGGRVSSCLDEGVHVRGYGDVGQDEIPVVRVRAPMDLAVSISDAANAEIGPSHALSLDLAGCVRATAAEVSGRLAIDIAGTGHVEAGAAGELDLESAGSATTTVAAVRGPAEVSMAGASSADIAAIAGPLKGEIMGSGAIRVARATLPRLDMSLGGSGDFELGEGSSVGEADIEIAGSGQARIGGSIETLRASLAGSGQIDVTGTIGALDAEVAGSGLIRAPAVTGPVSQQIFGSGRVEIGR